MFSLAKCDERPLPGTPLEGGRHCPEHTGATCSDQVGFLFRRKTAEAIACQTLVKLQLRLRPRLAEAAHPTGRLQNRTQIRLLTDDQRAMSTTTTRLIPAVSAESCCATDYIRADDRALMGSHRINAAVAILYRSVERKA